MQCPVGYSLAGWGPVSGPLCQLKKWLMYKPLGLYINHSMREAQWPFVPLDKGKPLALAMGQLTYQILYGIRVSIGTILLIVPGIIISFMFCMGPIIFAENPEVNFMDAFKKSKDIMNGHKMKLFLLDLSFIGWGILCLLSLGIGFLFLSPYMECTHASFYEDLIKEGEEE